jgi:hypothetical protein
MIKSNRLNKKRTHVFAKIYFSKDFTIKPSKVVFTNDYKLGIA